MTADAPIQRNVAGDLPRVDLFGVGVHATSFEAALEHLHACVERREATFFCNANVYSCMLAQDDAAHRAHMRRAGYVMADGMPIVWLLRWLGYAADRVHGDDFMLAWCQHFPGARHYLLGGAPGQTERVAAELQRRFPGIAIVGMHTTAVRPVPVEESRVIADDVRATRPDVIWVGMGTPHQDQWMADNVEALSVPMVGVGSAFDVLAGHTRAAPAWMKRSGLQWLFRLAQEPRRLGKRYVYYNTRFLWQVAGLLLRRG